MRPTSRRGAAPAAPSVSRGLRAGPVRHCPSPVAGAAAVAALVLAGAPCGPGPVPLAAQDTTRAIPVPGVDAADVLGQACVPLRLTVDATGRKARFRSVRAALRHASREEACAVRVRLRPGEHRGSFSVDRDTEIVGPRNRGAALRGTVSNRGPHRLVLRSLRVEGADFPGAVSVRHPRARTELRDVTIVGAGGYGVRQRGGRLAMERVGVHATGMPPAHAGSGVAVLLTDGARGRLEEVTLVGSAAQALVVRGSGTRARASDLRVTATGHRAASPFPRLERTLPRRPLDVPGGVRPGGTSLPPAGGVAGAGDRRERDGVGAVEVASRAILLAEHVQLFENELVGIHVHDGGRAHLREGAIRRSAAVGERGGVNVAVVGGTAELRGLALSGADLVGLLVAGGASVLLEGSLVRGSEVGVALRSEVPLDCLRRDNRFSDNGVNLDVARPPAPGGADPGGAAPDTPDARCARVPWR